MRERDLDTMEALKQRWLSALEICEVAGVTESSATDYRKIVEAMVKRGMVAVRKRERKQAGRPPKEYGLRKEWGGHA